MRKNYVGLVLGVSLFTCLIVAHPARSAVVSSCDETSLRAAIAHGGIVTFPCDGVISLANPLVITNDVILNASGREVSLSGGGSNRVFEVRPGASLTLVNLTIRDGVSTNAGAILNYGNLTLNNCILATNIAAGLAGSSGADGTNGGPPLLHSFDLNSGGPGASGTAGGEAQGGAILNAGNLFATNTYFRGNFAVGGTGGAGGTGGRGQVSLDSGGRPIASGAGGDGGYGGSGGAARGSVLFNLGTAHFAGCSAEANACLGGLGGTGGTGGTAPYNASNGIAGIGGIGGPAFGTIWNGGAGTFFSSTLALNRIEGGQGGAGGAGACCGLYTGSGGLGGSGADARGGGVWSQGSCIVSNSTLADNTTRGGNGGSGGKIGGYGWPDRAGDGGSASGAAIFNNGSLSVVSSTLWNNSAKGGSATNEPSANSPPNYLPGIAGSGFGNSITTSNSTALRNTIVGGYPSTSNCLGIIVDGGHNICSDTSANFTVPTSRNNLDPLLGPLANNGGPTLTMAVLPGSPAIDAGSSANFPPTDQRGVTRPQGLACDIGAFELSYATTIALTENAVRAAIETGGSFTFNLSGQIALSAPLVVSKNTTLDASGQAVVLSGNNAHRVFEVLPGASLTLVNLTIRDGVSTNGGGILVDHGELHATGCRFVNNLAQGAAGREEQNGASATSGGTARGGAIFGSSAVLMLTNNVFLENNAKGGMGGAVGSLAFTFPNGGSASGGAVAGDDLTAVGINCRFETNHSLGGLGGSSSINAGTVGSVKGGAWDQTTGSAHFEQCAFIGNIAQAPFPTNTSLSGAGGNSSGGALFLGAGTMHFENVRFERNASLGGTGRRNSSGGSATGGAVANLGNITLTRCLVTGNRATPGDGGILGSSGYGGAIQNLGTLNVTESWFENNSVSGAAGYRGGLGAGLAGYAFGGAIWNTGRLNIAASTFSLNSAVGVDGGLPRNGPVPGELAAGGALANSGLLIGTNLTFANNTAMGGRFPMHSSSPSTATAGGTAVGGALFQWGGTSVLAHVTMASNSAIGGDGNPLGAGLGGGIAVSNGVVSLTATIVSESSGASNCFGSLLDGGNNICSDASAGFSAAGSRNNLNPVLGPLADYGGRVPTMALLGGSPAIDAAGMIDCPATDERGISRPFGSACDIGAFESSPPYTILGRVSGYLTPPGGIQISTGVLATAPDQTGRFALHGLPPGTHLVVPASADAVFVTSNRLVTLGPDIAGMEFWSYRTNALVLEKAGAGIVHGTFAAAPGQTFHVEMSDNFSSWSPFSIQTTASSGLFEFWDTNSALASARVFRVTKP